MANALQKTKIVHLYRDSLKTLLSWAVSREVFYDKASGLAGSVHRRVHECAWLPQAAFRHRDTHPSCTDAAQAAELRKVFEANASLVGGVSSQMGWQRRSCAPLASLAHTPITPFITPGQPRFHREGHCQGRGGPEVVRPPRPLHRYGGADLGWPVCEGVSWILLFSLPQFTPNPTVPYRPGGSLYARNPPFPDGVRSVVVVGILNGDFIPVMQWVSALCAQPCRSSLFPSSQLTIHMDFGREGAH